MDNYQEEYKAFQKQLPQYITDKKQQEFFADMFKLVSTDRDTRKITCIPARCGTGKSVFTNTYIRYLVDRNNNNDVPVGLVVITDSLRRLDELSQVNDGEKQIISLNSDTPLREQIISQHYKPIVLLSTQRYARLSEDMREQLFSFTFNGYSCKRDTVIFDEKPYFFEIISIDMRNLNDIQTALYNGLSDQVQDKEFVLGEFKILKEYLTAAMDSFERYELQKNVTMYWINHKFQALTTNDELFYKVIEDNQESLIQQYSNILRDLENIKQLMSQGGIFNSIKKRNGNYEKSFYIIKDNRDSFYLNQDRKIFVFDAGADISPEYDMPYVDVVNCDKYAGNMHLEIVNVNISSSKNKICKKDSQNNKELKSIQNYIRKKAEEYAIGSNSLFLTYSDLAKVFQRSYSNVAYFGNLRGWNTYRDCKYLFHIGLNRYPNLTYFLLYCGTHPEEYKKLADMSQEKSIQFFEDLNIGRSKYNDALKDIMIYSILADFEQNIFRTAIRKPSNTEKVIVWTFYNNGGSSVYNQLSETIERRYKRYGAVFKYEDTPMELAIEKTKSRKAPNGKEKTNAQLFLDWFMRQDKGRLVRMKDIVAESSLRKSAIDELKKSSPSVKQIFKKMSTDKKGWYRIPV